MLLLLAIALVLIGVVTLVIGIISNTLAWVFISIGATVAAGIVLYILYRLGRKQAAAGVGAFGAAEPATAQQPVVPAAPVVPAPTAVPPAPVPAAVAADAGFAPGRPGASTEELDAGCLAPSPVVTALPDSYEDEEDLFPIAEYDDLRVAEILPLLPELDADELDVVREREAATKARATILNRIDELAPNALGAWTDGAREEPAEVEAPVPPAPAATGRRAASAMPIPGYDDLTVAEILPALTRLGAADLEVVADHERRGPNRQTVLNRIQGRIRSLDKGTGDEPAAVPARNTPAARSARTTTGRSTARKGPATPTPTALPTAAKRSAAGRSTATRATKATAAAVPAKRGRPAKAAAASASAAASKATGRKTSAAPAAKAAKAGKAAGPARKSKASPAPAPRATKRSPR